MFIANRRISILTLVYLLVAILVIIQRVLVLQDFGFVYTDQDQIIMWLGTQDYAQGVFHEPRFYGQAYNTMLESLFAIPLYRLGIPLHKALPIATSFMMLFPFFVLSIKSIRNNQKKIAILILCILLLLPLEFEYMTTMSRGFVPGIFISSIMLFFASNKRIINSFLLGFLAVLSFSINPNSLLLSLPILGVVLLNNINHKKTYLLLFLGFIAGLSLHWNINYFYTLNPNYNLHPLSIDFSIDLLNEGLNDLNKFFNHISPFCWSNGWLIILIFMMLGFYHFKRERKKIGVIFMLFPLLMLLPLLTTKVHDGVDSVFFHVSRMFLAVPVVLGFALYLYKNINRIVFFGILVLSIFTFMYKINSLQESISNNINKPHFIEIRKNKDLIKECNQLKELSNRLNLDLIILNRHYYVPAAYGCSICEDDFPQTFIPYNERRTWLMYEYQEKVFNNILINDSRDLEELYGLQSLNMLPNFYYVKENKLKTLQLIDSLNMKCRDFKP